MNVFVASPPLGLRSIAMNMPICPLASQNMRVQTSLHLLCACYTCGLVRFLRQYDMLCISSFVDDVMFLIMDHMARG